MKHKLLILIAAIALVAVCLVACGETATTAKTTTDDPAGSSTEDVITKAPVEKFESLKIADNELSSYTIVYAESDLADEAEKYPKYYPVWDFNKETAERVSDLIFDLTGVRLAIACDTETTETANEILIGETNRGITETLVLNKIKMSQYKVAVSGTKLVICGGRYGSTWHAVDYLEELLTKQLNAGNANYAFASDHAYEGNFEFTYIGCIGDSITQGVKVSNTKHAYPAQLERWLWKDAIVYNFGNSGKTLRDDLSDSYMKTNTYKSALLKANGIDIFTVMLGTNDSNRDRNWSNADTEKYKTDYETLFRTLWEKNNDMQFVIMNAPACFEERIDAMFGSPKIRAIQEELVSEMNDKGYKTSFFDMYSVTQSLAAYYPDNLHPDDDGHTVMAEELAKAINLLINPETK